MLFVLGSGRRVVKSNVSAIGNQNKTVQMWDCLAVLLFTTTLAGCSGKPDSTVTIPSPNTEVFYTVETSYGNGPVSNDFSRVYAHFTHAGKQAKQVVLSGEYIEHSTIAWTSPTDVDICVAEGITDTYRNKVTLITGDDLASSYTIHNHLKERC